MKWLTGCTAVMAIAGPAGRRRGPRGGPARRGAAKAFVVENVRVPNEQDDASTNKVSVQFPPGFAEVSFAPVPGWKVAVKKTKLAEPITTDEGDKLTEQVSRGDLERREDRPRRVPGLPGVAADAGQGRRP